MTHLKKHALTHWDSITRWFEKSGHWLLLFDFDGTLAPIVATPERARMSAELGRHLQALAKRADCYVGVISGRSLRDIKKRVPLKDIIYAGNHGLEIWNDGWGYTHPDALGKRAVFQKLAGALRKRFSKTRGALIEDKVFSLSLHYRNIPKSKTRLFQKSTMSLLLPYMRHHHLHSRRGKKVIEILPTNNWDKGSAVSWLRRFSPAGSAVLYIGDDLTDEDAFQAVSKKGIAVRIGYWKGSKAPYYLRNQKEIGQLIGRLRKMAEQRGGGHD